MTPFLATALAIATAAALAALYGRYRVLPAFFTGPTTCTLEAGGCQALFRTKEAALLGPPNAALGVLLYLFLSAGLTLSWSPSILLAASSPALCMSVWLATFLVRRRLQCRICWIGHIANLAIWLTIARRFLESS